MLGFVRWKILVVTTGLNGMARIPPARAKFFKFFEQGTAFCCSYGDEFATVETSLRTFSALGILRVLFVVNAAEPGGMQ